MFLRYKKSLHLQACLGPVYCTAVNVFAIYDSLHLQGCLKVAYRTAVNDFAIEEFLHVQASLRAAKYSEAKVFCYLRRITPLTGLP